jgi:inosine-uridine nucleoside N-ribohydrolase
MTRAQFATLAATGHPVTRTIQAMTDFYYDEFAGPRDRGDFSMHDPLCVAAALYPDLIDWRRAQVEVEFTSGLTAGATVARFESEKARWVDLPLAGELKTNALASVGVDRERFVALYLETLAATYAGET